MQHTYQKGTFASFRAITKIHLGAISDNLHEGEVVEYDGYTMKRGGDETAMHTLRAAVKVGWLVPVAAPETKYVPQPAGVVIHRADGLSDEELEIATVKEEDVNVGTLSEVRPKSAPATHRASDAAVKNDGDGVVVSRIKTSAKQAPVEIGKDDRKVVQQLDNKTSIDVEKVAVATGDVEEAIGGHDLTELLPDAASTGVPDAGVYEETEHDADSRAVSVTEKDTGLTLIRQFIPDFEWDTDLQWAKRVKIACEKYAHVPPVIEYIKSVETPTVVKHINKRLAEAANG